MKAARWHGRGDVRVEDVPRPSPGPGELLLCLSWAALGLMADGGLAEYAVVPAFSCARLPESLSDEEGALVEPTEVAVRAVRKSELRLGETVAVVGGGTIGLLTAQVARAAGA